MNESSISLISQFFTKANITLLLSIIGSFGTLIALYTKRKNLKIQVSNVAYKKAQKQMLLDITFENRSQLPIAITDVHVFLNNHELTVEKYPLCVEEYSH